MKKILTCLLAILGLTTAIPGKLQGDGIDVRIRHYE